jgi:hypothetical protein
VKVAHMRLCHSRIPFVRAYPRETQLAAWLRDFLNLRSARRSCRASIDGRLSSTSDIGDLINARTLEPALNEHPPCCIQDTFLDLFGQCAWRSARPRHMALFGTIPFSQVPAAVVAPLVSCEGVSSEILVLREAPVGLWRVIQVTFATVCLLIGDDWERWLQSPS